MQGLVDVGRNKGARRWRQGLGDVGAYKGAGRGIQGSIDVSCPKIKKMGSSS